MSAAHRVALDIALHASMSTRAVVVDGIVRELAGVVQYLVATHSSCVRMDWSLAGLSSPSWVWTMSPLRSSTTVNGSAMRLLPSDFDNSIAPKPPINVG